jgi:carboxyl-terminal processing protease
VTNYQNIYDSLLGGEGHKVANGKIEWGLINKKIGYINIHGLTGFASNELPRKQHLDTLDYHLNQAVNALQHTDAIIIDLSFNFGGYDAAGLTIAGYFTDQPVMAYSPFTFYDGEFYKGSDVYVNPSPSINYTKPVYLLTTDISRSAAETYAMQMKALPHVTLAGTPTLGILSGMLGKNIGDFYLTCSNEKYVSPEGKSYEVNGVEADIPIEVFPHGDVFNGHKRAVRKLVDIIEGTMAD